jgi:hypothetical protein
MSDRCFICGEDNPHVLEEHHIVPRRHGGSDDPENLVTLCANCHSAIEKLYDDDVFRQLGAAPVTTAGERRAPMQQSKDAVRRFLDECDHITVGVEGWATKRAVRELYSDWSDRYDVDVSPTARQFGLALSQLCEDVESAQRRIGGGRVRVYTGIVVKQVAGGGD